MDMLDKMAAQAQQPNPAEQLKIQEMQVMLHDKIIQRSLEARRVAVEEFRAMLEAQKTGSTIVLNEATAIMNLAKGEAQKVSANIDGMVSLMESLLKQAQAGQPPAPTGAMNDQSSAIPTQNSTGNTG